MGAKFSVKVVGQNVSFATQAVYFDGDKNVDETDYYAAGTRGYGANIDFGFGGNLYQGDYGTVSYGQVVENHWRNATGTNNYKNSWKIKSVSTLNYQTPTFLGGFYAGTELYNEWIRHTASAENGLAKFKYTNEFNVTPYLGYKTSFSTPIGEVAVNPYVKYRAFQRYTKENGTTDNDRVTTEEDRLHVGVSLGLNLN